MILCCSDLSFLGGRGSIYISLVEVNIAAKVLALGVTL